MPSPDAINKMVLRMRAAGLSLEGMQLSVTRDFTNPSGFEFRCNKVDRLLTMAVNSRKLGANSVTLPGSDAWRDEKIDSIGYSEIGVYNYLHLDFSTNREGLTCVLVEQNVAVSLRLASRAYVLENGRITLSGSGAELLADDRVRQAYLGM